MVQPLRPCRTTRLWLTRLDLKARDADLRVRCRVLLKVHAGRSPHRAAREIGCHPATACRIVARFVGRGEGSVFGLLSYFRIYSTIAAQGLLGSEQRWKILSLKYSGSR